MSESRYAFAPKPHGEQDSRSLSNIATRRAAAERPPSRDASFDAVLCRFSAHHPQKLMAGLRQARCEPKPGGRADDRFDLESAMRVVRTS